MGNELRLIIRNNNDSDGITEAIIREFRKHYENVSGIVLNHEPVPRERDNEFDYIDSSVFLTHDNPTIREATQPIDGSILQAMLPYKSMAMHIMMRTIHFDVFDREYLERIYYLHLKYWNQLIDDNRINLGVFMVIPHHVGEYILYSLCCVKDIKTIVMFPLYGNAMYAIGNSIEDIGNSVATRYHELTDKETMIDEHDSEFDPLFDNVKNGKVFSFEKKIIKRLRKEHTSNIGMKSIAIQIKLFIRERGVKHLGYKKRVHLTKIKYIIKARMRRISMDKVSDYNRYAVYPDKDEEYILFPLQVCPEATTMPLAGEFKNQILSIELLSAAIDGMPLKLYVKEHWANCYREKGFYKAISRLKNVKMIRIDVNSLELMDGASIVVSQTGSCLLEALIKNKPAISIKGNLYKGCPNIVVASDLSEIKGLVNEMLMGKRISKIDVYRYLRAMAEETVCLYLAGLSEASSGYNKDESAKKIVRFVLNGRICD